MTKDERYEMKYRSVQLYDYLIQAPFNDHVLDLFEIKKIWCRANFKQSVNKDQVKENIDDYLKTAGQGAKYYFSSHGKTINFRTSLV